MDKNTSTTPVKLSFHFGSYTNHFHYKLLFSLKQRKWLGRAHKGATWAVEYKLLPGRYLLFAVDGYKDERGADLRINLVQVTSEGEVKSEKCLFSDHFVGRPSHKNRILADFIAMRPGYHGCLTIPTVTYSQEDVDQILGGQLEPLTPPEE